MLLDERSIFLLPYFESYLNALLNFAYLTMRHWDMETPTVLSLLMRPGLHNATKALSVACYK